MGAAEELFGRYVHDVKEVLFLMKETNSVAVGDAVLSTFMPSVRRPMEMLEVIPSCSDTEQLVSFQDKWKEFLFLQGYEQKRVIKDGRVCHRMVEIHVSNVLQDVLYVRKDGVGIMVKCVVKRSEMQRCLMSAWGTHLMCIATYEAMYSFFPKTTFERHVYVELRSGYHYGGSGREEYAKAGLSCDKQESFSDNEEFPAEGRRGTRSVDDGLTRRDGFSDMEEEGRELSTSFSIVDGYVFLYS